MLSCICHFRESRACEPEVLMGVNPVIANKH